MCRIVIYDDVCMRDGAASPILRFKYGRVCGSEVSILRSSVQFASTDESADLRTAAAAYGGHDTRSRADNPLQRKALRQCKRDLNRLRFVAA